MIATRWARLLLALPSLAIAAVLLEEDLEQSVLFASSSVEKVQAFSNGSCRL